MGQNSYRNNVKVNADGTRLAIFYGSGVEIYERNLSSTTTYDYVSIGKIQRASANGDFDMDSSGTTIVLGRQGLVDIWKWNNVSTNWTKTLPSVKSSEAPAPLYFGSQVSISGDVSI